MDEDIRDIGDLLKEVNSKLPLSPGEAGWAIAMLAAGVTVEQVIAVITAHRAGLELANQNELSRLAEIQDEKDRLRKKQEREGG